MAERRSSINFQVLGLQDLRDLNAAMNVHEKRLNALTAAYVNFNAASGGSNAAFQKLGQSTINFNNTINNLDRSVNTLNLDMKKFDQSTNTVNNNFKNVGNTAKDFTRNILNIRTGLQQADRGGRDFLGTMLQYRAVSLVFEGITRAVHATVEALYEMEKQAARVQRVSPAGQTPFIRAGIASEGARTGADIKDISEAYYQLKTQIKDNDAAFSALQTTMNLVVGTQSDARDTARAMLQIYNQFGAQLDKTVGQGEQMRRIGELLAITFKDADAEMVDITAALKYLGPIADAAKVPLQQITGTISALTAQGQRGRMGGTEAGQFIANLIKNYSTELRGIEKNGLVFHFDLKRTADGGIDLLETIRSIVQTANTLPTDKAQQFLQAVSGSQNSFRFLGTAGSEFMRHLTEEIKKADDAIHGLTSESEKLRVTMTTTGQEWQRVWTGSITAIANSLDASGIKAWFHGIANDLERINGGLLNMQNTQLVNANTISGGGSFAGDTNAANVQRLHQKTVLQEVLDTARERGVSGRASFYKWGPLDSGAFNGGLDPDHAAAARLFREGYEQRLPAERGYLQRFIKFPEGANSANAQVVTMDIPAMQAELARLKVEIFANSRNAPLTAHDVPAASTLGLKGLSPTQAQNAAIITAAAKRYGIDPLAMIAVAHYESGLNANARNATSTATGLFQELAGTAPGINRSDPYQNAQFAARAIAQAGGRGLVGEDAIKLIVQKFERPGPVDTPKEIAGAIRFYNNQGIGKGGYNGPAITEAPDKHGANDPDRLITEAKDKYARLMQAEYERTKARFGADDERSAKAAKIADDAAAIAGDEVERFRLKYGLTGNVAGNRASAIKEREDRAKAEQDRIDTREKALEEQRSLYSKGGVMGGLAYMGGFPFSQDAVDAFQNRPQFKEGVKNEERRKKSEELARQESIEASTDALQRLQEQSDSRSRDLQRRAQSGGRFGDPIARGIGGTQDLLKQLASDNDDLIAQFDKTFKAGLPTHDVEQSLRNMAERIKDATAELQGFKDALADREYQQKIKAQDEDFDLRGQQISRLHGLRFNKDENRSFADEMQKLRELLALDQERLSAVLRETVTQDTPERIREAQKRVRSDQDRLSDYPTEVRNRRASEAYYAAQQSVHGSFKEFFSGRANLGQTAERIGGTIVDASLDKWLKQFTDPLVQTVASEILAIQGNTEALRVLTGTMTSGGEGASSSATFSGPGGSVNGFGAVVASGVEAGMSSVFTTGAGAALAAASSTAPEPGTTDYGWGSVPTVGGGRKAGGGQSDLQKGIGAGLAAYSIFSNAQQQGSNLGSVLGGAAAGFAIGGPVGAAIGGGLSLLGGLFHHSNPESKNPALYHSPSDFEYEAYRYRLQRNPGMIDSRGFAAHRPVVVEVHTYNDGVKTAVTRSIAQQSSTANSYVAASRFDVAKPY